MSAYARPSRNTMFSGVKSRCPMSSGGYTGTGGIPGSSAIFTPGRASGGGTNEAAASS